MQPHAAAVLAPWCARDRLRPTEVSSSLHSPVAAGAAASAAALAGVASPKHEVEGVSHLAVDLQ